MQRLADLVRTGHVLYVSGEIDKEKANKFSERMEKLYDINQNAMAASRKRRSGKSGFRLLLASLNDNTKLTFFLLRTDGEIPDAAMNENWRNALQSKIEVTGYHLLRKSRKGSEKPSWTWEYTKDRYQQLFDGVITAIRKKSDKDLSFYVSMIQKTQGFAGARVQAQKLLKVIKDEWKRHRGKDAMPKLPGRIGYNRRLPTLGRVVEDVNKKRAIRKSSVM